VFSVREWRARCSVGGKYIPGCFDSLRGPMADVSSAKAQKNCFMGTRYSSCQSENSSYSLVHVKFKRLISVL
jgi:hypothetical protein